MEDMVITVDVSGEIDNFKHFLEMYAGATVQSDEKMNYFISMAVLTFSPNYRKSYLVDKVYDKIASSMIEDFGQDYPKKRLEDIVREWGDLADAIKASLKDYLYEQNLDATFTYRKYIGNGCIQVILHENKDDDEV